MPKKTQAQPPFVD